MFRRDTLFIVQFKYPLSLANLQNGGIRLMREGVYVFGSDTEDAYVQIRNSLKPESFDLIEWQTLKIAEETIDFVRSKGGWKQFSKLYISCNEGHIYVKQ